MKSHTVFWKEDDLFASIVMCFYSGGVCGKEYI